MNELFWGISTIRPTQILSLMDALLPDWADSKDLELYKQSHKNAVFRSPQEAYDQLLCKVFRHLDLILTPMGR